MCFYLWQVFFYGLPLVYIIISTNIGIFIYSSGDDMFFCEVSVALKVSYD